MGLLENLMDGALLGGILIGLAFGILTLLTGRVLSASGMIGSLLGGAEGVAATSIAFIGGIVAVSLIMTAQGFAQLQVVETSWMFLTIGGFLVGVSARLGGASLGGAITGIARRAPRSLTLLLTLLAGAGIGSVVQGVFVGGGGA